MEHIAQIVKENPPMPKNELPVSHCAVSVSVTENQTHCIHWQGESLKCSGNCVLKANQTDFKFRGCDKNIESEIKTPIETEVCERVFATHCGFTAVHCKKGGAA